MVTRKATHANRGSGARLAQLKGAKEESIKKAGRWSNGAMEKHYLFPFSMSFLRTIAGFDPVAKNYYLPRARINPPPTLLDKFFPEVSKFFCPHPINPFHY